ncbi:fungal specific transcription factor factor domain-containing protein [Fusarium heterosporum]|uniref:Fungal specific transcription factor factor domain-containing protein n=1 Tax=Fusarium heterosporum TaxID=42747 RepID=A0A8H5U1V9_FUSHE|nr:fungal specific transcription factor factor domain-containing protein [Fusarium heterosporum]
MDREREITPDEEPPQKRQRVLACKSGDQCVPTEPAPRALVESHYVRALEERVAELEKQNPGNSMDHFSATQVIEKSPNNDVVATEDPHTQNANGDSRRLSFTVGRPATLPDGVSGARRSSGVVNACNPSEHLPVSPMDVTRSAPRGSYSNPSPSASAALPLDDDSDTGLDYLIYGLVASPSICEDGRHSVISAVTPGNGTTTNHGDLHPHIAISTLPIEVEQLLINAYKERAQAQYPMLYWNHFLQWLSEWKTCSTSELPSQYWKGFFINLVYSTALLVLSLPRIGQFDTRTFYKQGMMLLPHVLKQPSPILHVQAYMLLSIHALHRSSTPRVISLASTTMRYCIQYQFHLVETEPEPVDVTTRLEAQLRRRCFWSAYAMDRLVMSSFELPPSVSDVMISTKVYANIDDQDLEKVAAETSADQELPDSPTYTSVSSSLHILQCRRIQSEIFGYTLRWDYKARYEDSLEWRVQILNELEHYKLRVQNFADLQAKGHTSQRWLAMIYHYTLLTLYRPTKDNVLGPAGDWSIQASSQACLIYRKSQMDRQIAQAWLGLLVQFQSGVTILYCCWATPPEYRTENYYSPDVSDALRACSNILALLTDRWPKAECLRDVFELLAREVPLVDRPNRPPTRISDTSAATIKERLNRVKSLIVHRSIIRMIEEMVSMDFPRMRGNQTPHHLLSRRTTPALPAHVREKPACVALNSQTAQVLFELPFTAQPQPLYDIQSDTADDLSLRPDELLEFPGVFDLGSWA